MNDAFNIQFAKIIADAKKVGVCDDKTAMLIKDFLNTIKTEITRKEDQIKQLMGEIMANRKLFDMWSQLIRNQTNLEQNSREIAERQTKLMAGDEKKKNGRASKSNNA